MSRTTKELSDDQAAKARAALLRLREDAGGGSALARYLSRFSSEPVSVSSVNRWLGKKGRPGIEAWKLLVAAEALADDPAIPPRPRRPGELDDDDVRELRMIARRLSRIAERLG